MLWANDVLGIRCIEKPVTFLSESLLTRSNSRAVWKREIYIDSSGIEFISSKVAGATFIIISEPFKVLEASGVTTAPPSI